MPTVLDGHSRAEWPVALHVLHKLDMDTCRSSGDAQIARTAFKSSGSLSGRFDASQIRSQQRMACTMKL